MSEAVEVNEVAECPTTEGESASADPVTQQHDAASAKSAEFSEGDHCGTVSVDVTGEKRCGPSAYGTVADGTGRPVNDRPQSSACLSRKPVGVCDPPHSAVKNSACVDEKLSDSDNVDNQSSSAVVEPSVTAVSAAEDVPAKPCDASTDGSVVTGDRGDTSQKSRSSSTVGCSPPVPTSTLAVARHALPSAVAAPRARGKHRLPPVLTPSAGQGHGFERLSPLSLVVGAHPAADAVRASSSLTGGTRLGDLGLGLGVSQPPLNLSVSDEAVNMKVVSTATQRSAADTGSRAGMYIVQCVLSFVSYRPLNCKGLKQLKHNQHDIQSHVQH